MADEKTFSEKEHIAILADRVSTETANLTAERDQLRDAKGDLENKLDVTESAKAAAEQRALEAEKALEDFKAEIQEQREAASRKDERLAKLRESAAHLDEGFFADEARVARIVAMKDEEFAGYQADLAATSTGAPKRTEAPRETAMQTSTTEGSSASVGRGFLLRRYVAQEA